MSIVLQPGDSYVALHTTAIFLRKTSGANWMVAFTMSDGRIRISLENSWRIIDRPDLWKAVLPL